MARNFIVSTNYANWDENTVGVVSVVHYTHEGVSDGALIKDLALAAHTDKLDIRDIEEVQLIPADEIDQFLDGLDINVVVDIEFDLMAAIHINGQMMMVIGITEII